MAAVNIARRASRQKKIVFIVSRRFFDGVDYGVFLPAIYKKLKVAIVNIFFPVIYVDPVLGANLTDVDRMGVLSSLKSITHDSAATDFSYPRLFASLSESAIGAREIFDYLLKVSPPNRVYVFNGRTASSYPIVRGCFDHEIPVAYYEYGSNSHSGYRLYPYPPHSTTRLGADISQFRKVCLRSIPELYLKGKKWRHEKLNNVFTKGYSETVSINYDVVIFLGSDHEYTCVDEDISGFKFLGNLGLVKAVIAKYGKDYSIAVRAHPNQLTDKSYKSALASIEDICHEFGLKYYGPDSKISSYALIESSSIVAVEFSSIAYDAIFLGKKVDIFGDLDLRVILSNQAGSYSSQNNVSEYVSEVVCLYEDLFSARLNPLEELVCKCLRFFEWRILRSHAIPKLFLENGRSN